MSMFHSLLSMGGVTYDADYQAWLNRLTALGYALPTDACSQILSDMVAGIKTDGNWTELDRFLFFAHNGDSDGATVDMVDPTHTQATKVSSPGWTAKEGFYSNGTSSYVNNNYTPSADAVHFTLNSASVGVWLHTGGGTGGDVLGVRSPSTSIIRVIDLGTTLGTKLNGDTPYALFGGNTFSSNSSYSTQRTSSGNVDAIVNGTINASSSAASVSLPTLSFFTAAFNNIGTPVYANSAWRISAVWIGSSSVDQSEMHTRLSTAMTAIALLP